MGKESLRVAPTRHKRRGRVTASRRARVAARVTAVTLRPLTAVIPLNRTGVVMSRAIVAASLAAFSPRLAGTGIELVDERNAEGQRVRGEWVRARRPARDDAVILYLHGSGYVICSPRTHRGLTSRLSAYTGLAVFSCDYRLAPKHRFPSAADDVSAAFRWLLAQGYAADKIIIAGDSAGGHLAVDLTLELGRAGHPAPGALVMFSPLYDTTFALAGQQERLRRDPMISAKQARKLLDLYTNGADPVHQRLALATADAKDLPPMLIQAGGAEMLSADAKKLADDVIATGGRCELEVWPGQMHVFQALPLLIPESKRALRKASSFILRELAGTRSQPSASSSPSVGDQSTTASSVFGEVAS